MGFRVRVLGSLSNEPLQGPFLWWPLVAFPNLVSAGLGPGKGFVEFCLSVTASKPLNARI